MWKFEEFKECQSNRWLCYITLTLTLTVGWYGIVFGMPTAPIKFGLAILLFAAGTIFAFFQHFHNLSAKEQPVLDGWMWALNTVLFTGVLITAFYYSFQFQPADSKAGYISYVCYLLKRGIYSLTEKQIYSGDCMLLLSLFLSQIVVWIAESIKSAAILKKHKDKYSKKFLFFAPYGLVITTWLAGGILAFVLCYTPYWWVKIIVFIAMMLLFAPSYEYVNCPMREETWYWEKINIGAILCFAALGMYCNYKYGEKDIKEFFKWIFVKRDFTGIYTDGFYTLWFAAAFVVLAILLWHLAGLVVLVLELAILYLGDWKDDMKRVFKNRKEKQQKELICKTNTLVAQKEKEMESMKNQINVLKNEVEKQLEESKQVEKNHRSLMSRKDARIQELQKGLEDKNRAFAKMEELAFKKTKEAGGLKQKYEEKMGQLNQDIRVLESKTENLEGENQNLKQKLKLLEEEKQKLKFSVIQHSKDDMKGLESEIEILEEEKENLKQRNRILKQDNEELRQENEDLKEENEELKQKKPAAEPKSEEIVKPIPFSISCELLTPGEEMAVDWSCIGMQGRKKDTRIRLEELFTKENGRKQQFNILIESAENGSAVKISGSIRYLKRNHMVLQPKENHSWVIKEGTYYILTEETKELKLELD